MRIIIIGLDNAGKTTILCKFNLVLSWINLIESGVENNQKYHHNL